MHRKTCKMCDVQFVALRSDKITCGARCRKAYERQCRRITEMMRVNDEAAARRFESMCKEVDNNGG
jgi:hypothetical protein